MQNTPYNNNQGYYPPPGNQPPYVPPQPPRPPKAPGTAIASMVLGIISDAILVLFGCFGGFFVSLPCSVVGLILGIISYKQRPSNPGLAGLITNIIAMAINVILIILFTVGIYTISYSWY